ncbi:Uncharacterized protein TCAP_02086 [Tolypocladium capitatum]|uniref:Uncharacterized protein n=1 Tax=Tolypocladium capitatum TaxID=45235 RepID=A0A2K3QKF6_9HYPO|nr:Uncharacterized protein TCAP_02086 [Tolypocladium capitatum]
MPHRIRYRLHSKLGPNQEVAPELLEEAPHDELVHARGEEEGDEGGGVLVYFHGGDGAVVDVAQEEDVDGAVPIAGKLVPGDCTNDGVLRDLDHDKQNANHSHQLLRHIPPAYRLRPRVPELIHHRRQRNPLVVFHEREVTRIRIGRIGRRPAQLVGQRVHLPLDDAAKQADLLVVQRLPRRNGPRDAVNVRLLGAGQLRERVPAPGRRGRHAEVRGVQGAGGRRGGGRAAGRVDEVELLELVEQEETLLVDGREVAVVECVRVLLHDHDDAVEDEEDGVRPGPVADEGPGYDARKKGRLPHLFMGSANSFHDSEYVRHLTFCTIQPPLSQLRWPWKTSLWRTQLTPAHKTPEWICPRRTISVEHGLHNLIRTQRGPVLPPIVGRDLEDEQRNGQPEENVESVKGAVRRGNVVRIKGRELLRKDEPAEPAGLLRRLGVLDALGAPLEQILDALVVFRDDVHARPVSDDGAVRLLS